MLQQVPSIAVSPLITKCQAYADSIIPRQKMTLKKKIAESIDGIMYGVEEFSGIIEDLRPNTTYYIRAYAMNFSGRTYSEIVAVKTLTRTPESNDNVYPDIDF